jgi:hypothetical protein
VSLEQIGIPIFEKSEKNEMPQLEKKINAQLVNKHARP